MPTQLPDQYLPQTPETIGIFGIPARAISAVGTLMGKAILGWAGAHEKTALFACHFKGDFALFCELVSVGILPHQTVFFQCLDVPLDS